MYAMWTCVCVCEGCCVLGVCVFYIKYTKIKC